MHSLMLPWSATGGRPYKRFTRIVWEAAYIKRFDEMRDAGCGMRDTGYGVQDTGFGVGVTDN